MSNQTEEEYTKDSRTPCKYGLNCYQRNPFHLSKYKHPPRKPRKKEPPAKKIKIDKEVSEERVNDSENNATISVITDNREPENKVNDVPEQINVLENIDEKEFIKSKFLVEMPSDFYNFWNFCKALNDKNPLLALNEIQLMLVGPFDVLAGKFNNTVEKKIQEYVLHWRYYYDPPEFQTVIKQNDDSGYHIGYFRDSPEEMPIFLACNFANTDGTFTIIGDNLFAAVNSFLDILKKNSNPFMQINILKYSSLIQKEACNLKLSLSTTTSKITSRNKNTLAKTFNKLGFVVPYNKKSQLGYRPLTVSNKELQTLLKKLKHTTGTEKDRFMAQLQELLTNTNIAIDECDFGTGIELGLDILFSDVECLNSVVARLLATSYRLVNREAFAVIIESHMKKRKKDFNLSIL